MVRGRDRSGVCVACVRRALVSIAASSVFQLFILLFITLPHRSVKYRKMATAWQQRNLSADGVGRKRAGARASAKYLRSGCVLRAASQRIAASKWRRVGSSGDNREKHRSGGRRKSGAFMGSSGVSDNVRANISVWWRSDRVHGASGNTCAAAAGGISWHQPERQKRLAGVASVSSRRWCSAQYGARRAAGGVRWAAALMSSGETGALGISQRPPSSPDIASGTQWRVCLYSTLSAFYGM